MYYNEDYKTFLARKLRYDFAIIDPPWSYNDKPPAVTDKQLTYSLWEDNIKGCEELFNNINVDYIFLWVTNSMIEEVFKCKITSGFSYKTLVTWVKMTQGKEIFYGLGNTFRNSTEHIMVFQRDKTPVLRLSNRTVIVEEVGKRTVKPKKWEYELVKKLEREKGLKGVYIFSGGDLDFIDCVDTIEENRGLINDLC